MAIRFFFFKEPKGVEGKVRKLRIILYTVVAIASLVSLRDKEIVVNVPDVKRPLVAEAYHPTEPSQDIPQTAYLSPIKPISTNESKLSPYSPPVPISTETTYYPPSGISDSSIFESGLAAPTKPQTDQEIKPQTSDTGGKEAQKGGTPNQTYYGFASVVLPPSQDSTGQSPTTGTAPAVNNPPNIISFLPQDVTPSVNEGETINFSVTAQDPDGDALAFTWQLDSVTQSTASNSWTYRPNFNSSGTHIVKAIVSDASLQDEQSWTVTVIDVVPQPRSLVITGITPDSGLSGIDVIIQGLGFSANPFEDIVKFGTLQSNAVNFISQNQIHAQVPSGVSPGFTDLSVTVNDVTSNLFTFDILKDSTSQIFVDMTSSLLPQGINIQDASILRLCDIDNDKDTDLFIVDGVSERILLLVNNGSGIFTDQSSQRLPSVSDISDVTALGLGDVDGDSRFDMLVTYSAGQSIRLFLNDGTGGFSDATTTNMPVISGQAVSCALGDVDGDGDLDAVIANKDTDKDTLLINDGTGIFDVDIDFILPEVLDSSSDILFCDLDGDGDLDIVTTNNAVVGASSIRNRVYINDGKGSFIDGTQSSLPSDDEASEVVDSGDLDGDGDMDIIFANHRQNSILINNGSGVFQDETGRLMPSNDFDSRAAQLGDIDGDGDLDIVVLGESAVSLLLNDGTGYFEDASIKMPDYQSYPAPTGGKDIELSDIDGDGDLDIVIGGSSIHILVSRFENKPPVLDPIGSKRVEVGDTLSFNVSAQDPNNDPLTYLLENRPTGSTFQSQLFSWSPVSTDIGAHMNVRFIAREETPDAFEDIEDIIITVTSGDLPVIDYYTPASLNLELLLGQLVQFGVRAHDPNSGTLTFKWFFNGVEIPAVTDATSSLLFIFPRLGENSVKVVVGNSAGSVAIEWRVTVGEVINHSPEITSYTPLEPEITIDISVGAAVNFGVNAEDADGDTLSYTWKFDGTVISTSQNLDSTAYAAYITIGDHLIKVEVSDGHNPPVVHQWILHIVQTGEVTQFLEELSQKSFLYFVNEANPLNGLVRDRVEVDGSSSQSDNISSIAATGFGLTALCIGAERGWITLDEASARALSAINTFLEIQNNQATNPGTYGISGFFYHFINMDTAERINNSEVSTIDTAILVTGALTAGEYFGGEVKTKADALYRNVDWSAFLNTSTGINHNLFHMAWAPESGFSATHWNYSSEALMLYLLAIGSPTHQVGPDVLYSFRRVLGVYGDTGLPIVKSWFGSLFTYQYSHTWFDFRNLHDAQNVNWFKNSISATIANRQFSIDNAAEFGYGENFWGLSASDGPLSGYTEYGAPPLGAEIPISDGTVSPSASAGSIAMAPDIVIPNLLNIYNTHKDNVWARYGFIDSLNLKPGRTPWYSSNYLGIDVGITLLMLENYRTNFVWNTFMQNQYAVSALTLAGFTQESAPHTYVDAPPVNDFTNILLTETSPTQEIIYDIPSLQPGEYLLVLQPFGMDDKGIAYVDVAVSINGIEAVIRIWDWEGLGTKNMSNFYILIDSSVLRQGANSIVLTRRAGEKWLSLKKVEIKGPRAPRNVWTIGALDSSYAEFGDEWLVDDSYYAGEPYNTFEKALNINDEAFTDILFYVDDLSFDRELVLHSLQSDGNVSIGVMSSGGLIEGPIFMTSVQTKNIAVPRTTLRTGWNILRLVHAGETGSGEWITWDNIELNATVLELAPPEGLAAASFGADRINIRWEASALSGVDGYNLYRSQTQGGQYVKINTMLITGTSFQDTGLADRTTYYYVVTAVDNEVAPNESSYSGEIQVATGDYELDYGDGKEPNAFGGSSSGQFSFIPAIRHDWSTGKVRRVALNPSEEGWIGLNNVNLSQAGVLSMWINGTGLEIIQIGLKGAGSQMSVVSVTVAEGWQNLRIKLSDFAGLSLSNAEKLSIISNSTTPVTLYLDGIVFIREAQSGYTLEVKAKSVSNNSLATGMDFDNSIFSQYAPSNQYTEVKYGSAAQNWKIWIYTKNDNGNPLYLGGQFNGLMSSDGRHRVPLIWRVYPDVQPGGVACRVRSDIYSGDNLTWNYIKDKNDSDWAAANPVGGEYSVVCYGRASEWANLAGVPPGLGDRHPVDSTFYVYLGGIFETASAGDYATTIYFDLTHE